jgi:hypothetical protein
LQVAEIEARIANGQAEELIEQAKSELKLIPQYASWRVSSTSPLSLPSPRTRDTLSAAG